MIIGIIIGIILILYFFVIASHTHLNSKFPLIWLLTGGLLIVMGVFIDEITFIWNRFPIALQIALEGILLLGMLTAIFLIIKILQYFSKAVPNNLSYIIVLGAQMKPKGPSLSLKRRLDRAVLYMEENRNTVAILSGGQGKNEPIAEAEGMRIYMMEKGINANRLLTEDQSVNTYQNLCYSKKAVPEIEKKDKVIGIVTSNFHMYRAKKIAEKMGLKKVACLSAKTEPHMLPTAVVREIIAIVKDFLMGNI